MKGRSRIEKLQQHVQNEGWAFALLFYSRDIFYYTGTAQPSYLVVRPDDYQLFVRSGIEFAKKESFLDPARIREERRLERIRENYLAPACRPGRFGLERDLLTWEQNRNMGRIFPELEIEDVSPFILRQRREKDASEIADIRLACDAVHAGHLAILENLREGMTELELAALVENAHRLAGHEGIFFMRQPDFFMSRGPISSGPNLLEISGVVYTITGTGLSPSVPAGPSRRKIARGDLVMCDIPTHVRGYHADQTRTYCLGKAPPRAMDLHDRLREIADFLREKMKPGVGCRDLFAFSLKKAEDLGCAEEFMSFGKGRRSRLIGHGIGIELNEPPIPSEYDKSLLAAGQVIALDMHMMDESVVVKLEDMIWVKEHGTEILTPSPRELFEIK